MKIRVFTLAEELGMEPKVLLRHAQALGINLKSSVLAPITPEDRERIIASLPNQDGPDETNS